MTAARQAGVDGARHARRQAASALGFTGYAPGEERPLAAYATLAAVYGGLVAGGALAARRRGIRAPERIGLGDLALAGVATHKLSRLLTKDKVSSFIRAPFTRFQDEAGYGEVEEEARGRGLRRAIGELVLCPYCISQWVATGFVGGLTAAPRGTRLVASVFVVQTASDVMQLAYHAAEQSGTSPPADDRPLPRD